jgi:TetR/AcrR family transcriptional regulator, regulator of biofilm formation and stress response
MSSTATRPDAPLARVDGDFAPGTRTRGVERRELLLQVTLRLIAGRGIDAVSHRAVAELAGVPLGSTTYWFGSRQEMLREALEYFVRLEIESLRERLAGVLGKRLSRSRVVDEFTAFLLPQLEEERWRTVAQYALLQEAVRQPELETVCREWDAAWEEVLVEVFSSLRARDPELEARMFLAMLDGLLLGQLATPHENVEEAVLRPALEAWFSRIPTDRRST